jgi:hypothetical protein
MESTIAQLPAIAGMPSTTVTPARRIRSALAALRPPSDVQTSSPFDTSKPPMPLPISPAPINPIRRSIIKLSTI